MSANRYLPLFELGPRAFGQTWGEAHLHDLDARFRKPDKELDPEYDGQYDLWIDGVRVEVKAARAVNSRIRGGLLANKALAWGSDARFWLNYQQLKLDICDVFVFVGVWVDRLVYWVMSDQEVGSNRFLSPQHRGGIEFQLGIRHNNIRQFDIHRVTAERLTDAVMRKGGPQPGAGAL